MKPIFIARDGKSIGPFTLAELDAMLASGRLLANDLAWSESVANWTPLHTMPGISLPQGGPPPPMPPLLPSVVAPVLPFAAAQVSHALPWVSAFVPLAGLVFDAVLNEMGWSNWVGTMVVIGTNILLLTKDEKELKAQGFSTERMGAAWLVPVYLFKRVQVAGGGYGYAVCWMITLFISMLSSL